MNLNKVAASLMIVFLSGCAFSRHQVIFQTEKGPHGGVLVFLDKRMPEYAEFNISRGEEWTFQVFNYDKQMKPKSVSGGADVKIILPDGIKKSAPLWNTKPFIWNRGIGHLENKIRLGDVEKFSAELTLKGYKGRPRDALKFSYPFNHSNLIRQSEMSVKPPLGE